MQENPPAGHTLAEHREYLHEIVRLQLFFLHGYCREHPEEAFRDVLESRVDIYRKTDANPGPADPAECFFDREPWLSMRKACEMLYRKHQDNREAFELEAFEVFRKSLDARCRRDWLDRSSLDGYQCGSLRHESALRENKVMFFHIANAVSPRSFLDDAEYLGGCFLRLLDIAVL